MILIIDTNIIHAALLKDSITRGLLIDCPFDLYAPETPIKEIKNMKMRYYEDRVYQNQILIFCWN